MDLSLIADLSQLSQMFLFAADASWGNLWGYGHIAKMAIGLGTVIFVHELGHFLAAKACGVKAEKFYVGFDVPMPKIGPFQIPSKIFHFQWGETEYGLGIIPLGGYVKMLGQDDNPANAEKEAEKTRVKKDGEASEEDVERTSESAESSTSEDHHKSVTDVDLEPQPLAEDVDYELDPRSYTAKNVPQRMLIISAGVIMNVIFAVIFATIAYRLGVPYTPAVIGSTAPGSPAWKMDLQPGTQVLAVGKDAKPKEEMRFLQDMAQGVMLHGYESDLSMLIRPPGEEAKRIAIRPVPKQRPMMFGRSSASIGVSQAPSNTLAKEDFVLEGFPAARAKPGFEGGDTIIAGIVNGEETQLKEFWDMDRFMARHVDDPISLKVERIDNPEAEVSEQTKSTHVIELGTRKLRRMGLVMTMGPVTAVQNGSPAGEAMAAGGSPSEKGIQEGDLLISLNGEPIQDPMTFPDDVRRLAGEEVTIGVKRDGKEVELTVTPRQVRDAQGPNPEAAPVLVDALGLTYDVESIVTAVDPRSSAKDKIKPGDEVTSFKFVAGGKTDAERKKNEEKLLREYPGLGKAMELTDERYNWTVPYFFMQTLPEEVEIELTLLRDGEELTAQVKPYASEEYHIPTRGVRRQLLEETHTAENWGEAFSLGMRETKESLLLVVNFLKKLVSGDIPIFGLGGPGMIVAAASSEASVGTSRLLIFLTMLSANLAVVNFLPIPVLDGGHMMFLLYEGIFRKPVNEAWQIRLSLVGFAFLICLMAFVIGLDIVRFAGGGG